MDYDDRWHVWVFFGPVNSISVTSTADQRVMDERLCGTKSCFKLIPEDVC